MHACLRMSVLAHIQRAECMQIIQLKSSGTYFHDRLVAKHNVILMFTWSIWAKASWKHTTQHAPLMPSRWCTFTCWVGSPCLFSWLLSSSRLVSRLTLCFLYWSIQSPRSLFWNRRRSVLSGWADWGIRQCSQKVSQSDNNRKFLPKCSIIWSHVAQSRSGFRISRSTQCWQPASFCSKTCPLSSSSFASSAMSCIFYRSRRFLSSTSIRQYSCHQSVRNLLGPIFFLAPNFSVLNPSVGFYF